MFVMSDLIESLSLLVHIAQVEHGLCVALLLRGKSVMCGRSLIVDAGAPPVVVVVTQLHPGQAVALQHMEHYTYAPPVVMVVTQLHPGHAVAMQHMEDCTYAPPVVLVVT